MNCAHKVGRGKHYPVKMEEGVRYCNGLPLPF